MALWDESLSMAHWDKWFRHPTKQKKYDDLYRLALGQYVMQVVCEQSIYFCFIAYDKVSNPGL